MRSCRCGEADLQRFEDLRDDAVLQDKDFAERTIELVRGCDRATGDITEPRRDANAIARGLIRAPHHPTRTERARHVHRIGFGRDWADSFREDPQETLATHEANRVHAPKVDADRLRNATRQPLHRWVAGQILEIEHQHPVLLNRRRRGRRAVRQRMRKVDDRIKALT